MAAVGLVIALPTAQREQYVTLQELAAELRVSENTIRRWVKAGCPHERWGLRILRFQPSRVKAWASQRGAA